MKNKKILSKLSISILMVTTLFIFPAANSFAQDTRKEAEKSTAQSSGAALSTGLISLAPGQSIRVSAVNVGGKNTTLNFAFFTISEQGKLAGLVICPDMVVSPGNAAIDKFTHPGGNGRMMLYVQVRVYENPDDIKKLIPALEITDEQTGAIIGVLHSGDFAAFRPLWVPS